MVRADDRQHWGAVKAFTLFGGTRVPKNAVLTTIEMNTGPQEACANRIEKMLDACDIFTKVRVQFVVANMPHKTSIAHMRAHQKPRWKWELAWAIYVSLHKIRFQKAGQEPPPLKRRREQSYMPPKDKIRQWMIHTRRAGDSLPDNRSSHRLIQRDHFMNDFYCSKMKQEGLIDFPDMLRLASRMFEEHADIRDVVKNCQRYILVDEFQDVTLDQFEVLKHLVRKPVRDSSPNTVGDDDMERSMS